MHTGVDLDSMQCIAYKPTEKWKASPEFVMLTDCILIKKNNSKMNSITSDSGDKT